MIRYARRLREQAGADWTLSQPAMPGLPIADVSMLAQASLNR